MGFVGSSSGHYTCLEDGAGWSLWWYFHSFSLLFLVWKISLSLIKLQPLFDIIDTMIFICTSSYLSSVFVVILCYIWYIDILRFCYLPRDIFSFISIIANIKLSWYCREEFDILSYIWYFETCVPVHYYYWYYDIIEILIISFLGLCP